MKCFDNIKLKIQDRINELASSSLDKDETNGLLFALDVVVKQEEYFKEMFSLEHKLNGQLGGSSKSARKRKSSAKNGLSLKGFKVNELICPDCGSDNIWARLFSDRFEGNCKNCGALFTKVKENR